MAAPTAERVDALHRFGRWAHREPLSLIAAVVAGAHLAIVALYMTGQAVSTVPFTQDTAATIVNTPLVWIVQLIAAGGLALGVANDRMRGVVSYISFAVWLGYAIALLLAAKFRQPPLGLVGFALAIGFSAISFVLLYLWRGRDEDL